jgi:hypothetical protein
MQLAVLAGVGVGIAYALSPLAVWFAVAAFFIARWAERGLPAEERRWVRMMLVTAIVLRVLAVVALFSITDHTTKPFGIFFGDEEFFIRRSISLRNLALGVPIHSADLIYAFDEVGQTSYLYVLAWLQALVGPAPYGVHLVGAAFYLAAAVLLFRMAYRSFGHVPAIAGFATILFLPTLFAWSVSALKESAFLLLTAGAIAAAEAILRSRTHTRRTTAALALIVLVAALESLRRAGAVVTATSVAIGFGMAAVLTRPRALIAAVVLTPIVLGAALSRPFVQVQAYRAVQRAAEQQQGHIHTAGYAYKTLDDRFYYSVRDIDDMRFFEAARFAIRSVVSYIVVPLPWNVESRSTLAYLPEQIVWYVMVALLPVGFVCALRRDALLASMLLAFALVSAALTAVVSGNIGTLVRHRGMVIPLIVWLSAVGAFELVRTQPS